MSVPIPVSIPLTLERRDLPLDVLAARIGEELDMLARLSAEVQAALALCRFNEHTNPGAIRGLQGIDRITQSLEDLGRLMAAISGEVPADISLHAAPILSRLRLHELVQSLDPGEPRPDTQGDPTAGDIDWL